MRTDSVDPFYRRALAEIELNDFEAATADLEEVIRREPKYDYHRAAGLLAHSLGKVGRRDEAHQLFADVTRISTLSETQYLYASLLAAEGKPTKLASGRSESSPRSRRCRRTSAGVSVAGSARPAHY